MQLDTTKMREAAEAKRRAAMSEYHESMRIIEAIEQMARQANPSEDHSRSRKPSHGPATFQLFPAAFSLDKAVISAVGTKVVTMQQVFDTIAKQHADVNVPRKRLSQKLYDMHKAGTLQQVRKQKGSTPAQYRIGKLPADPALEADDEQDVKQTA
jgi:hypothetical protein